ncbi:MAG: hypothetical protein QM679_09820 [Patulibacter sp.]
MNRPDSPLGLAALLVLASALLTASGASSIFTAAAALLAPGFALNGLLPSAMRRSGVTLLCAAPALGVAASSVALISLSRLGVPLTAVTIHLTLLALVAAGWRLSADRVKVAAGCDDAASPLADTSEAAETTGKHGPRDWIDGVLVTVILAACALLARTVIGATPVPGNDWAKYLLYAAQIAEHHRLLLENPYWLGGMPFREDPGVPSLYGSLLILSGSPAGALAQGIVALQLLSVAALYASVRVTVGRVGALAAAALLAVAPATQNILGWHGLANVGGFVVLSLMLGVVGLWCCGELGRRSEAGLALLIVALAAAHRLTFALAALMLCAVAVFGLGLAWRRGTLPARCWSLARTGCWIVVLGLLVALDLRARSATSAGTMPYTAYLTTKVQLSLAMRDVSPIMVVLGAGSFAILAASRRLPRGVWPAALLGAITLLVAYAWVAHLAMYYARMVYYWPVALAPLAGAGIQQLAELLRPPGSGTSAVANTQPTAQRPATEPAPARRLLAFGAAAAIAVAGGLSVRNAERQATIVRDFYGFANAGSLRGLNALSATLKPREPVTTDRCWSFLATWLLSTPTYPALADQDIGPRAELALAKKGRSMLSGSDAGQRLAQQLGVRYALLDPTCPTAAARSRPRGEMVYASERLAIVRLRAP